MTSRTFITKTARRTRRYGAALVGAAALSLASGGVALAQQPTTPAPQAPPAAADLSVSVSGERDEREGAGDAKEGKRYEYRIHVINDGPGAAQNVRLMFNPPDEFNADDTSEFCQDSSSQNGMDCLIGTLRPGEDAEIVVTGEPGESGRQNTWAVVSSDSEDANLDNNTARHRIDVEEDDD